MFSASLNKHEEGQNGQRKSQSQSSATNHTQGVHSNSPGNTEGAPISLSRMSNPQLVAKVKQQLPQFSQGLWLSGTLGFSQDSQIGSLLKKKAEPSGFVYGMFFTIKFIAKNATRLVEFSRKNNFGS